LILKELGSTFTASREVINRLKIRIFVIPPEKRKYGTKNTKKYKS